MLRKERVTNRRCFALAVKAAQRFDLRRRSFIHERAGRVKHRVRSKEPKSVFVSAFAVAGNRVANETRFFVDALAQRKVGLCEFEGLRRRRR